jgi:hypothetical protein
MIYSVMEAKLIYLTVVLLGGEVTIVVMLKMLQLLVVSFFSNSDETIQE